MPPASLCMSHGQCEEKSGSFPRLGLHPNSTTVAINDLFANGQTDAGAGVFSSPMQALEDSEYSVGLQRIDTNAIVADREKPHAIAWLGGDMNALSLCPGKLYRIAYEILKGAGRFA